MITYYNIVFVYFCNMQIKRRDDFSCKKNDLTLLTDLYQLTMMQGYQEKGLQKKIVVFDLFYRKNPSGNGYAIAAGLEQAIEYINQLQFSKQDIDYLESLNIFSEGFIDYLKQFRFTGEIYAIPEEQ